MLPTASEDRTVRLWDVDSDHEIRSLEGHIGRVLSAAFSLDGKLVVTTSDDRIASLWSATIQELLKLAESLIQRDPPIFTQKEWD